MYKSEEEKKWEEIELKKRDSMAWLNAMNNAALIFSNHPSFKNVIATQVIEETLARLRDIIYSLNIQK